MSVVPEGGYGTSVNPTGVHFPFIREVPEAKRLFSDMYLGHKVKSALLPLRVSEITGFTQPPISSSSFSDPAAPFRAELVVVDAENAVVFDSATADRYSYKPWSDRFAIHEWVGADVVCRVVQHTGQHDPEDVLVYPDYQTLTGAVLDERVSEIWPDNVTKIIVNGNEIDGDIEFVGGYNFTNTLASTDAVDGNARINSIFVAAVPGSGLGLTPGCPEQVTQEIPIRNINKAGPDARGSFVITGDECISIPRPGITSGQGSNRVITFDIDNGLTLKESCLPCCSCDDFMNTYRGIRRLYDKYAALGVRAEDVRMQHKKNVDRWNDQKTCRESAPVKIAGIPYTINNDSCLKVALGVCNSYEACRGEFTVDVNFNTPSGLKGYINPNSIFAYDAGGYNAENYVLEGSWPNYKARWPIVDSQKLAKIKFDMSFSREPKIVWDSAFKLLDGPAGNVVMDGRFVVLFDNVTLKTTYSIVGSVFWTDPESTIIQGSRVDRLVGKTFPPVSSSASNVLVTSFLDNTYNSLGNWSWKVLAHPTSVSVKPYTLRLKYDDTGTWFVKDAIGKKKQVYSGRLYADTLIVPTFVSKVNDGDYATVAITAKLNGDTIAHGTLSETFGLKVL
jgi:hypothetical protein